MDNIDNESEEYCQSVMDSVLNVLKNSEGLCVEVLAWAFMELKSNPELTISQAIGYGFGEWVK